MTRRVSDYILREVINRELEDDPGTCPLCAGRIDYTIVEMYDQECVDCKTKFSLTEQDDDGVPLPAVDLQTTPLRRLARQIEQRANEQAIVDELDDLHNTEDDNE